MNGLILLVNILLFFMLLHLFITKNWNGLLLFSIALFLMYGTGHGKP